MFRSYRSAPVLILSFFYLMSLAGQSFALSGPYLGQNPPGLTPVPFAPDVLIDGTHSAPCFSSYGNEVYWSRYYKPDNKQSRIQHIFFSKVVDGEWSPPALVSFSGTYNDGGPCLSPDNNRLYFYSNRPVSGHGEPESEYGGDIWFVERTNDGWGEPKRLSVNTPKDEKSPSIARDGTMYFMSNRTGSYGIFDIFVSEPNNGDYTDPKNIGKPITSANIEFSPMIAPDESYIIFNYLNRPEGNGLYVSFRKEDGSWGDPIDMGPAINASMVQRFPGLSPDGKYFFFSRESRGESGIFWVDASIIDSLKPANLK